MKIIPAPPTDNLYKFLAIFGLWLCTIVIAFLGLTSYLVHESGEEVKARQNYLFAKERVEELSRRIKAIDEGRYAEDIAKHIPPMKSIEQEREFLERIRANFQETLADLNPGRKQRSTQFFESLEALGGSVTVAVFTVVATLLISFGFLGWYQRVQRPGELAAQLESELKGVELMLKRADLRQKDIEVKLKEAELRRVEREEMATHGGRVGPSGESPVPMTDAA